jgi:sirohydrochlorin cobaltochelatase
MIGNEYQRIALAMVGRGTSDPEALAHMHSFTELASAKRSIEWVSTGFFAGGELTVDQLLEQAAIAQSQGQPCDAVVVQPHLLFEGELMDQLRSKIKRCRQEHPDRQWVLARCLGADRALAGVFVDFVRVVAENL